MTQLATETERFVLSPSVEVLSVREFPEAIRERLGGSDDDYVLSDSTARIGSQLIGRDAALFLGRFREPTRIVDAVYAHSTEHGIDPHALLAEVYPFLRTMCLSSILIAPADMARSTGPRLASGDQVGEFVIVDVARRVGDTDVLKALSTRGDVVAIKRASPEAGQDVRENLEREAAVLEFARIAGCRSVPRLMGKVLDRDDPYLWMEWLDGQTLFDLLRLGSSTVPQRVALVRSLVRCYADLHDHGILHGDVHPNNVMVAADGSVRLLDFGGARLVDRGVQGARVGLVQFYEPEVARAILSRQEPPESTSAGEQYGVAGLAFAALTGNYPIALSLVTESALTQIASTPPRSFEEFGMSWPTVEGVLRKALAKQPSERFRTFRAFEGALVRALDATNPIDAAPRPKPEPARRLPRAEFTGAARKIKADYGLHSSALDGFDRGPKASIYAGGAGVALALLRIASMSGDAASLAAAEVWIRWAKSVAHDPLAFSDGSIGESTRTGELALFQSMTGVHAVDALVNYALGDSDATRAAIDAFAAAISGRDSSLAGFPMDATNGAASLLFGTALLLPIAPKGQAARLRSLGGVLAATVAAQLDAAESDNVFIGFAHGRAGAVYALLRWAEVSQEEPSSAVTRSLDELAALSLKRRGSRMWPIALDESSQGAWTGWCHGTAGHLLLWSLASRVIGEDAHVEHALEAGRDIWRRRGSSGPSLCCGAGGEALALYELARVTGSGVWADRGRRLAGDAANAVSSLTRSQGLFRSALGVDLVAAESVEPQESIWPVLQSPL